MENIKKAVETVLGKNAVGFKEAIHSELAARLHNAISTRKGSVASGLAVTESTDEVAEANVLAPSAPATGAKAGVPGGSEVPDPLDDDLRGELESAFGIKDDAAGKATAKDDDISLDPNFEKEFYMKETDYKGHKVLLKQVGLGLSKPVRVYVDSKRWEFFPGPEAAMRGAKSYIDGMDAELAKEQAEVDGETISEKVDLDGRTRLYKATVARIESARKLREGKKKIEETPTKFSGLYNDGSGKGAIIPEPLDIGNKPSKVAENITGQKHTAIEEAESKKMSPAQMLAAVNMKEGKYSMSEEELSPKQKEYRAFFDKALKKHGVKSPVDLKGDAAKKKFFDYVKSNWKG